ncbi:MAG: nickel transporter [Lautropia sp.]
MTIDFHSLGAPAMAGLAFLLGARHGIDADHLASIDGISRLQYSAGNPRLARASGLLFSTGHGIVVLLLALGVALFAGAADVPTVPAWLDTAGALLSVTMLSIIGTVNLRNALSSDPARVGASPVVARMLRTRLLQGAGSGVAIGALFALSFDTVGLAVMFAAFGVQHSGLGLVALLGALFALGMMLSDTVNGWVVAHLIGRGDRFSRRAARVFALVLAAVALAIAGVGVVRLLSHPVDAWMEDRGLQASAAVALMVAGGYLWSRRIGAPR